jgi:hypothetical protein
MAWGPLATITATGSRISSAALPQSLGPTILWPTVFDDEGSSLDMAKIAQSLPQFIDELFCGRPCNPQDTNSWYVGLLCMRPNGHAAAAPPSSVMNSRLFMSEP